MTDSTAPARPTASTRRSAGCARCWCARPGLAHRRLTPTNADDLLFDDVMWVENAQRDHADFVNKLRNRGVEVVELHDLLAETMDDPRGARPGCSTARSSPTRSASAWSTTPGRSWSRSTPRQLAEYLIGGLAVSDLPDDFRVRVRRAGPRGRPASAST